MLLVMARFCNTWMRIPKLVVFFACFLPTDATELELCYTFYSADEFDAGASCGSTCLYRTSCEEDLSRSTCAKEDSCEKLLIQGQGVRFLDGYGCISCDLPGCLSCGSNSSYGGEVFCTECATHAGYSLDSSTGECNWDDSLYWTCIFIAIGTALFSPIVALLICVCLAEFRPATNTEALQRGRLMRFRSKLFKTKITEDGRVERYSIFTNIHGSESGKIAGPGHTLFMNWFVFLALLALYLAAGVKLFRQSDTEEDDLMDPCKQQDGSSDFDEIGERDGALAWAMWNYFGAIIMVALFLYGQTRLWSAMDANPARPSLKEFCVEFTGFPADETDRTKIRDSLGDWMETLQLARSGIVDISIAYDVSRDRHDAINSMLNDTLRKAQRQRRLHARSVMPSCKLVRQVPADISGFVDPGPLLVQVLAAIYHQTPIYCCRRRFVIADASGQMEAVQAQGRGEFLKSLRGSGTVFIIFDTQAVANAVASMGSAKLDGYGDVRVRMAVSDPLSVRWLDYERVSCWDRCLRISRAVLVFGVMFYIWMMAFFTYLSFEVFFQADESWAKEFFGTFIIGLLVPLGNAVFGMLIDNESSNVGTKDEESLRMWRLILGVFINGLANFGEVVLIHKSLFDRNFELGQLSETLELITKGGLFVPFGQEPGLREFHERLTAILFPAGLMVPLITIPLLENVVPFWVGRLRMKRDTRLTASDAERILKPGNVELVGPYCDMVVNLGLVAYCYWLSAGSYLFILWIAVALWSFLQGVQCRMNLLRWHGRSWFGGKELHACMKVLIALPLGFLASVLYVEWQRPHGYYIEGFLIHIVVHICFVYYILPTFQAPQSSRGFHYNDVLVRELAPIPTYMNTNPVEVLKSWYAPASGHNAPLNFYRNDKWYLHLQTPFATLASFEKEECMIVDGGIMRDVGRGARVLAEDLLPNGAFLKEAAGFVIPRENGGAALIGKRRFGPSSATGSDINPALDIEPGDKTERWGAPARIHPVEEHVNTVEEMPFSEPDGQVAPLPPIIAKRGSGGSRLESYEAEFHPFGLQEEEEEEADADEDSEEEWC